MSYNVLSTLHSPTGTPPTPTPRSYTPSQRISQTILKTALQKANAAVILDKANDLVGAIDAYSDAVNLLDRVLSSETRESDRQRLQETYAKYLKRIHYLITLKSDTDHLCDSFHNGAKTGNNESRTAISLGVSSPQQGETQVHDTWVRELGPASGSNSRSNRMDFDDMTDNTFTNTARLSTGSTISQHRLTADKGASSAVSPALITPTSPSSSISIPVDAPPSPVSSKSTPSRSTSNRRSNDTLNMSSAIDSSSSSSTPPLEPRSSHHPSPRKSSKMGSAAALQLGSSTFGYQEHQYYAAQRRRSSITSLSSSSSGDSSDSLCAITGPYQPTMALPSLLLTKIEAAPTTTDSEINVNRHSNNSTDSNKSNQNQHDSLNDLSTTSSVHGETLQQAGEGRFRTSSLPRKLQFTRSVFGSMDTTDHTMAAVEPDTSLGRVVQRQPSGLSLRKKYNRLSRSSMDGTSSNVSNSGGRKDKSGPTLSVLFGGDNAPSSNEGQGIEHVDLQHHSYYGSATTLESKDVGSSSRYSYQQQPETSSNSRYLDTYLKLIINLEHSMNCGGFVTPKLYIPRNLWYQNNIRLSSMDVKVAACESLISDLNRIEKWRNLDDILGSLRLIESLEEVVDGLQVTLSKKLKRDSLVDTNDDNNNGSLDNGTGHQYSSHGNNDHNSGNNNLNNNGGSINKRAQLLSWGSKLTKSVERMNNFSLTKVEDQYRHYIEVLQKLFIKLHLLEMWFQHYLKKDRLMNPHYDTLLAKLGKVCDGINRVVGGFVLRDLAILLGKWLKRGGICVNE